MKKSGGGMAGCAENNLSRFGRSTAHRTGAYDACPLLLHESCHTSLKRESSSMGAGFDLTGSTASQVDALYGAIHSKQN